MIFRMQQEAVMYKQHSIEHVANSFIQATE